MKKGRQEDVERDQDTNRIAVGCGRKGRRITKADIYHSDLRLEYAFALGL